MDLNPASGTQWREECGHLQPSQAEYRIRRITDAVIEAANERSADPSPHR